jgi:hypothetical protein
MKKKQSLQLTNAEIRRVYELTKSIRKTSLTLGCAYETARKGISGARQCPSLRPGNLK